MIYMNTKQSESGESSESIESESETGSGFERYRMVSIGIDYDFRSQNMVLARLEPLKWLVDHNVIRVHQVLVSTSPTGRGWHVRLKINAPVAISQRELELVAGDDPFRHAFSWARGESADETPLFEKKKKGGVWYHEKQNLQMTIRVREELMGCL